MDIIVDDGELEGGAQPLVASDHQLMAELSDVPPAQLLDGGSEDMDMVRGGGLWMKEDSRGVIKTVG